MHALTAFSLFTCFTQGGSIVKQALLFSLFLAFILGSCVPSGTSVIHSAARAPAASQPVAAADTGPKGTSAPTTYRNTLRNFQITLPAGWEVIQDPNAESISLMKVGTTLNFNWGHEQMVPSFPRDAAVDAGLKQDKERVTINKLLEASRRDDGSIKQGCGVIGWEQTEAPQKNGFQRIIWQCYDGQNYYMNFMAATTNEDFEAARAELRQIMDSIKFCQ